MRYEILSSDGSALKPVSQVSAFDKLALLLFLVQIYFAAVFPYGLPAFFLRWTTLLICVIQVFAFRKWISVFLAGLGPFWPFVAISVLAALFGYDPKASFTGLGMFVQTVLAAVVASKLGAEKSSDTLLIIGFVGIFAGIIASVFFPEFGTNMRGDAENWKGFSAGKNAFGWLAALFSMSCIVLPTRFGLGVRGIFLVLGCLALVGSDSQTSLLAFVAGVMFRSLLKFQVRLKFSEGAAGVLNILMLIALSLLGALLATVVIQALGRDLTFTGRTVVWSAYLSDMSESLITGKGPTAYGMSNAITDALSERNDFFGQMIETPHNLYIALLGDVGIFGLFSVVCALYYVTFVSSFGGAKSLQVTAVFGFMLLVAGLQETNTPFAISLVWFLIFWGRAISKNDHGRPRGDESGL